MTMQPAMKLIAIVCLCLVDVIDCYKILGVFPLQFQSHWELGYSIMRTLAKAGHEVYFVSPFPRKEQIKNLFHIPLTRTARDDSVNMLNVEKATPFTFISVLSERMTQTANSTLSSRFMVEIMQSDAQIDLVITEVFYLEALYGLAAHFKCPIVGSSPYSSSKLTNDLTRVPNEQAYVPHNFIKYSEKMNFWQRTYNLIVSHYESAFMEFVHYRRQKEIYDAFFGRTGRSFEDQMKNVSLIFMNNHFSISSVRPVTANMIEIGGVHIEAPKPLPEEVKTFIDSATDGVILFSLGSMLQSAKFPVQTREAFVKVFSELKQKVIWKYENETLPNKPDNVMTMKWLPQRDILAHKNVKVFITHGGVLSMIEAVTEGVPLVGIPIYADQRMNMLKAEELGFGRIMEYQDIDEDMIGNTLKEVLKDEYRSQAKEASRLFKDRPMTPQKTVVYWTEYVIRNSGAPHFKSAAHSLNFIQVNLIDSYLLLLAISLTFLAILAKTSRAILSRVFVTKIPMKK